jgi:hypothetical protein
MIPFDLFKLIGGIALSFVGGITTYLAQFGPKEAEGWLQLGGVGISLLGAAAAIRYLVKANEKKETCILDLIKEHAANRESDREKFDAKWNLIRREDIEQREKDRATRDKLADAVENQATASESLARAVEGLKSKS